MGQIICISKKLPCGAAAAGLGPISFVFLICKSGTVTLVPLASHICADKKVLLALAGVAQWIECWPANQRVTGSILSQDTCLGCRPGPQEGVHERQPHIDVFLSLFLPASPL